MTIITPPIGCEDHGRARAKGTTDVTTNSAMKTKAILDATDGVGRPLGSVGIDEDGQLFRKNEGGVYNFTFMYQGYQFAVKAEVQPGQTRLRIHAMLGNVPYTAESGDLRINMQAIVHEASRALGGRVHVNQEQRVMLFDEFLFQETLTPNALLTKTVAFLLRAKPYLELLGLIAGATHAVHALLPPPGEALDDAEIAHA